VVVVAGLAWAEQHLGAESLHKPRVAAQHRQTIDMPQTYWLDLFTVETWKEFLDHGGDVTGFREKRWKTVQKIKHGDYLL
jgi:hypothetical protein